MPQGKSPHPVARARAGRGWTQGELAEQAKIPRTTVSAIEGGRLTPSVAAALQLARALGCSVEELFGAGRDTGRREEAEWAWRPVMEASSRYWEAETDGRRLLYPVEALSGSAAAHDGVWRGGVLHGNARTDARMTLTLAGCDPAAGLLASEYRAASGFRLLSFMRGGAAALELLKQGAVHVAALHRATEEHPLRNAETVREKLGSGYKLLRCADWEEGLALPAENRARSVQACVKEVRRWALREPGSAARECLDELLLTKPAAWRGPGHIRSHAGVAEAIRGGWAEAGVCVQLAAEEAGLRFLPVRTEFLDFCFAASLERDARLQALIRLLRSQAYRRLVDELPGYSARETGEMMAV